MLLFFRLLIICAMRQLAIKAAESVKVSYRVTGFTASLLKLRGIPMEPSLFIDTQLGSEDLVDNPLE